jgi:hypothetical protein
MMIFNHFLQKTNLIVKLVNVLYIGHHIRFLFNRWPQESYKFLFIPI